MNDLIRRELKVAFHRKTQSVWVRIMKYALLGLLIYFYWGSTRFWWIIASLTLLALVIHFFYRYKTQGWTRSYGPGLFRWDHDQVFGKDS